MQTKTIIDIKPSKNPLFTMLYFASERDANGVIVHYKSEPMPTSEVQRLQVVVGDLMAV